VDRLNNGASGNGSGIAAVLGPPRAAESEIDDRHKNIAYAVQDYCERAMMSTVRMAVEKTQSRNLCLAGGVALNSKANGKILSSGIVEKIFVQPAASDDGVALGAALAPYLDGGGRLPHRAMRHAYLGPAFDDEAIETALKTYKLRYSRMSDPAATGADLLTRGKILGWFQGRMEFGPRALGARSIIGDARSETMQSVMNLKIKFRESFRPFAPIVLREYVDEYFEMRPGEDSPYMLLVAPVHAQHRTAVGDDYEKAFGIEKLNHRRSTIPAVTHVDYSARVQTVDRERNPLLYKLMKKFHARTGCPVLINTSFNVRSEPIVCTPEDAWRCFLATDIDVLVLGNQVLLKDEQKKTMSEGDKLAHLGQFKLD
jgi:carbamoyltransferase